MPYTPSKFGLGPFGVAAYSAGSASRIDVAAGLGGRSGSFARLGGTWALAQDGFLARSRVTAPLVMDGVLPALSVAGRSSLTPTLRLYWEPAPPSKCGNDWVVQAPPPFLCPELVDG